MSQRKKYALSGPHMRFRGELKDCRHCPLNTRCMKRDAKAQGRQLSVLIESKRMHTIDEQLLLHCLHSLRPVAQPVFGNICSNKRLNKLSLRGEQKVTAQWQLYCMVHNVEKLWRYAA